MRIIEIEAQSNGAHRNQTGTFSSVPAGWAVIPPGVAIPDTFPFVTLTVDGQTVISLLPGIVPEPEPTPAPTDAEQLRADVDYIAVMTGVSL